MSEGETVLKQFQIQFKDASQLPLHYVNAMNLRSSPEAFFFTIGATVPPEVKTPQDLEGIDTLSADPVFRFVVSYDVMPSFISLMTQQYEVQQRIRKALEQQQQAAQDESSDGKGSTDGN